MWEYTAIKKSNADDVIAEANKLGKQGWEAVNFVTTKQGYGWGGCIMVLKRRIDSVAEVKSSGF